MGIFILIGCGAENLSQAYQIDRLRVLAIAAEPAEPRPGDIVTFDALIVDPAEPVGGSAWFVCAALASSSLGCEIDPSLVDPEADPSSIDIEALQEAGFLGLLPPLPPVWSVPNDWLDGLTEAEKLEGTFGMLYVTAFPDRPEGQELDEGDLEIAYKRVPVSEAPTPNRNPGVVGFRIDGHDVAIGATWRVDAGESYEVEVALADDAVESYLYRNESGDDEERTEEPWFDWYLQEGSFDQSQTLWPYTSVTWTAPEEAELASQSLWVVVRDRRGGMAWAELKVELSGG